MTEFTKPSFGKYIKKAKFEKDYITLGTALKNVDEEYKDSILSIDYSQKNIRKQTFYQGYYLKSNMLGAGSC